MLNMEYIFNAAEERTLNLDGFRFRMKKKKERNKIILQSSQFISTCAEEPSHPSETKDKRPRPQVENTEKNPLLLKSVKSDGNEGEDGEDKNKNSNNNDNIVVEHGIQQTKSHILDYQKPGGKQISLSSQLEEASSQVGCAKDSKDTDKNPMGDPTQKLEPKERVEIQVNCDSKRKVNDQGVQVIKRTKTTTELQDRKYLSKMKDIQPLFENVDPKKDNHQRLRELLTLILEDEYSDIYEYINDCKGMKEDDIESLLNYLETSITYFISSSDDMIEQMSRKEVESKQCLSNVQNEALVEHVKQLEQILEGYRKEEEQWKQISESEKNMALPSLPQNENLKSAGQKLKSGLGKESGKEFSKLVSQMLEDAVLKLEATNSIIRAVSFNVEECDTQCANAARAIGHRALDDFVGDKKDTKSLIKSLIK